MKKRLLAGLMAMCLVLTLLPASALAAEPGGEGTKDNPWNVSADSDGNNVYAYLTSNGKIEATYGEKINLSVPLSMTYTLHIEGTGAMKDFDHPTLTESTDFAPWYSVLKQEGVDTIPITNISIGDNITYLGDYAFAFTDVTEAVFGNITDCGKSVYAECDNLTMLDWDSYPLTAIPIGLLDGCDNYKGNGENNTLVLPDKITSVGQAAFRHTSIGGELVLGENITSDFAKEIIKFVKNEELENVTVVLQDTGFINDSEKLNAIEILNNGGIEYNDILSI